MLNQDPLHIALSLSGAPVLVYLHKTRAPVCFLIIYGQFCFYLIVDKDDKQAVAGKGTVGGAMITWANVSQPTETNGRPEVSVFHQNYNGNVIKKNCGYATLYIITLLNKQCTIPCVGCYELFTIIFLPFFAPHILFFEPVYMY